MKYFVYILFSDSLQKFYIGQTQNLTDRVIRHNKGYEKYTSKGTPWTLVWYTSKESRSDAIILERKLKNLKQLRLVKLMRKYSNEIQNMQIIDMLEKKLEANRVSDDHDS